MTNDKNTSIPDVFKPEDGLLPSPLDEYAEPFIKKKLYSVLSFIPYESQLKRVVDDIYRWIIKPIKEMNQESIDKEFEHKKTEVDLLNQIHRLSNSPERVIVVMENFYTNGIGGQHFSIPTVTEYPSIEIAAKALMYKGNIKDTSCTVYKVNGPCMVDKDFKEFMKKVKAETELNLYIADKVRKGEVPPTEHRN